jgi:hypothetical protein
LLFELFFTFAGSVIATWVVPYHLLSILYNNTQVLQSFCSLSVFDETNLSVIFYTKPSNITNLVLELILGPIYIMLEFKL